MNTIITHFYNEEYLLPWWIKHHRNLFDNGIMINYASTDRSVEICKELCPENWTIVDSKNEFFEAEAVDQEVKNYEATVKGYKIALNTTEFLFTPKPISEIINGREEESTIFRTYGVCMVDNFSDELPSYDKHLFEQKHHGMIRDYQAYDMNSGYQQNHYNTLFGRLLHNHECGPYTSGRHPYNVESSCVHLNNVFILKYKFSPWNDFTKKRIQQFKSKIPKVDSDQGRGTQHLRSEEEYIDEYNNLMVYVKDLKEDEDFKKAYDYCISL